MPLRIFTSGGADAATALIRAILERHKYQYEVHDVAADGAALNRYGKHCPGMELALLPVLYVRKGVVWIADDMPELEDVPPPVISIDDVPAAEGAPARAAERVETI